MSWNIVVVVSDTLRTAYLNPLWQRLGSDTEFGAVCRTERQIYERAPGMLTNNPDAPNLTYR